MPTGHTRQWNLSRRLGGWLLAVTLTAGLAGAPRALAEEPEHWAAPALAYAVETGMLSDQALRGADNATRAELADMVTRLLGLTEEASLSAFRDVDDSHPEARALRRAVALGLLQGDGGLLSPDEPVTRQQAFVILARAFALPEGNPLSLSRFSDGDQVGAWAQTATAGLVQQGLVQGSDGLLRPRDPISRQELAQLLWNLTGRVWDGSGGTAILPAGTEAPSGAQIDGDLYLCVDAGQTVTLQEVTITGRLVIRGGGQVTLADSTAGQVVLCDDGVLLATGGAALTIDARGTATITGGAAQVDAAGAVTLQAGDYDRLTLAAGTATVDRGATVTDAQLTGTGVALVGEGRAETVTLTRPDCNVLLTTGTLVDAIDYGLSEVRASLSVTAEPRPDAPTLRARLTLSDGAPLAAGKSVQVSWTLGDRLLSTQTVTLTDSAVVELSQTLDYTQSLPEGTLTATVTRAEESLSATRTVDLHQPQVVVETIEVGATVHTGTGLFADYNLTQYIGWVNAGTVGVYTNYVTGLSSQLQLPDGRSGWVHSSCVTISQDNYVRAEDYTVAEKESYVNQSGYESTTDYLVWISLKCQRVNVFLGSTGQWKLVQSFTVATGKNSTPTIAGVFAYSHRVPRWDFGVYYVSPVLVFNGGHAFHSRTYTPSGSLLDPTLGAPVSAGCIRMRDEDVGWLDQYLPLGSTVVVY